MHDIEQEIESRALEMGISIDDIQQYRDTRKSADIYRMIVYANGEKYCAEISISDMRHSVSQQDVIIQELHKALCSLPQEIAFTWNVWGRDIHVRLDETISVQCGACGYKDVVSGANQLFIPYNSEFEVPHASYQPGADDLLNESDTELMQVYLLGKVSEECHCP